MSNEVSLLSIDEAAVQAGVSKDTIKRYRDLGLLKIHETHEGERFTEEDIKLLFNSKKHSSSTPPSQNKSKTESVADPDKNKSEEPPSVKNIIEEAQKTKQALSSEEVKENVDNEDNRNNNPTKSFSHYAESEEISSIELIELTRSLKDQLEIVKEERNWLRKRIEKLESLSEREQMLRMSESDTIRTLIAQNERKRRNPLSFLLSWTQTGKDKSQKQLN